MNFQMLHPADQLVMLMDRIYHHGMTTTSGGNLSVMDENGDIWITPSGIDKGTLTRADIICVHPDGSMDGIHTPSVELPFHQNIYRLRADIKGIVHAHPPGLVGFSLARRIPNTLLVPNAHLVCGDVAMAPYAVPGSKELGVNISAEFAKGHNVVMLENHGVVCGAPDLFRAFMAFETLESCARLEIDATRVGKLRPLTLEQVNSSPQYQPVQLDACTPSHYSSQERAARREMCKLIHRAYDQKLFSSTQGTFAERLDDGSFIITPYRKDRCYLQPEDLVRISASGMCEAGKTPSRAVMLAKRIFDLHPEVRSFISAHPPAIMAYAVTDAMFDSRTIPESYLQLRYVEKVPFGTSYNDLEGTARMFSNRVPVIMVENDCVLVVGETLLNAFDRLEVAEYSAQAIINANSVGQLVTINDEQVKEIEDAFHMYE